MDAMDSLVLKESLVMQVSLDYQVLMVTEASMDFPEKRETGDSPDFLDQR